MQLSVKDLSKLLNVTEKTIYRWIKKRKIPVYRIHEQYRFNRVEILDWATAQKISISKEMFSDVTGNHITGNSLTQTIRKGGIYYNVKGNDKKALLSSVVYSLDLPGEVSREGLLSAMLLREELGSTGFGDGIAIPHARYPIVTHIPHVIVSICFSEKPVDFGAIDGKPVNCLVTLISPTVRSHLKMLSIIAFVLKDDGVKDALVKQKSREIIVCEIEKAEQLLGQ
ncbi:MAG: PTS sugar transporter subunit IIA [Candidatus Omnitrophica bacterium]|nr:PTS sugar transporter subunit IIA [Candidatus Omnitrophota bacterium]